jgi:hypothetical protein
MNIMAAVAEWPMVMTFKFEPTIKPDVNRV